jgi:hypothetical protein
MQKLLRQSHRRNRHDRRDPADTGRKVKPIGTLDW